MSLIVPHLLGKSLILYLTIKKTRGAFYVRVMDMRKKNNPSLLSKDLLMIENLNALLYKDYVVIWFGVQKALGNVYCITQSF